MALEKVAEATLESGRSPSHIIMWSDGAPNQFKYTYPIWFLSKFKNSKFKNFLSLRINMGSRRCGGTSMHHVMERACKMQRGLGLRVGLRRQFY